MNRFRHPIAAIMLLCALILVGCSASPQATQQASATPQPTATPAVVETPAATASPSPTETQSAAAETTAPAIKGLVLTVPVLVKNVDTISSVVNADGTYREELLYDGMVSIVDESLAGVESTKEAISKQITSLNDVEVSDMTVAQDATISTKLSYPAWRITYTTGANEDTRANVDIYIQTDSGDFRFHTSTPVDAYDEYKESIESWIESFGLSQP